MNKNFSIQDIDVVILCGGEGKRLKSVVKERPKPLAVINGRPFLDILIDYVMSFGFRRFILCIGYKGELIKKHYRRRDLSATFIFSKEEKLLGTAGAIKNAKSLIRSNPFLVINGDSLCKLNFSNFIYFYFNKKALYLVCLVKAKAGQDYGVVKVNNLRQITSFNEKIKAKRNELINAGIYLLAKEIIDLIPDNKKFSLEYDLFPNINNNVLYGYQTKQRLIDIGTPERYKEAKQILAP